MFLSSQIIPLLKPDHSTAQVRSFHCIAVSVLLKLDHSTAQVRSFHCSSQIIPLRCYISWHWCFSQVRPFHCLAASTGIGVSLKLDHSTALLRRLACLLHTFFSRLAAVAGQHPPHRPQRVCQQQRLGQPGPHHQAPNPPAVSPEQLGHTGQGVGRSLPLRRSAGCASSSANTEPGPVFSRCVLVCVTFVLEKERDGVCSTGTHCVVWIFWVHRFF